MFDAMRLLARLDPHGGYLPDVGLKTAPSIQVQVITGDNLTLVVDSKSNPTPPATFSVNITKQ